MVLTSLPGASFLSGAQPVREDEEPPHPLWAPCEDARVFGERAFDGRLEHRIYPANPLIWTLQHWNLQPWILQPDDTASVATPPSRDAASVARLFTGYPVGWDISGMGPM